MFLKYWQADHLNDLCLQLQKKIITCQKGNNYKTSVPELSLCTLNRILHNKKIFSSLSSCFILYISLQTYFQLTTYTDFSDDTSIGDACTFCLSNIIIWQAVDCN